MKISAKESIGHCEVKNHKPWFDKECSKLVDRRKQAKLQWLQNPSIANEDSVSNVRQEVSRRIASPVERITCTYSQNGR
jgi:Holliday junction resolvase-like predicted endonuclease